MDANTERGEDRSITETPADVAALFAWANLRGTRYRDFSAARREHRAQMRLGTAQRARDLEPRAWADIERVDDVAEATAVTTEMASVADVAQAPIPNDSQTEFRETDPVAEAATGNTKTAQVQAVAWDETAAETPNNTQLASDEADLADVSAHLYGPTYEAPAPAPRRVRARFDAEAIEALLEKEPTAAAAQESVARAVDSEPAAGPVLLELAAVEASGAELEALAEGEVKAFPILSPELTVARAPEVVPHSADLTSVSSVQAVIGDTKIAVASSEPEAAMAAASRVEPEGSPVELGDLTETAPTEAERTLGYSPIDSTTDSSIDAESGIGAEEVFASGRSLPEETEDEVPEELGLSYVGLAEGQVPSSVRDGLSTPASETGLEVTPEAVPALAMVPLISFPPRRFVSAADGVAAGWQSSSANGWERSALNGTVRSPLRTFDPPAGATESKRGEDVETIAPAWLYPGDVPEGAWVPRTSPQVPSVFDAEHSQAEQSLIPATASLHGEGVAGAVAAADRVAAEGNGVHVGVAAARNGEPETNPVERLRARWFALSAFVEDPPPEPRPMLPLPQGEDGSPLVALFSVAGGVGKTSMVATLGRALTAMEESVVLTDTTSHGILPFFFGARAVDHGVVRTFAPPAGSRDEPIHLVNYEIESEPANNRRAQALADAILQNGEGSHRVMLDLAMNSVWLVRRFAELHPLVLVPLIPEMNSVISLEAVERVFEGILDGHGQPVAPIYVLNQFEANNPLHLDIREILRRQLGDRLLRLSIRRSAAVPEALAEGMTVLDYAPEAPVAEDYQELAAWLKEVSPPTPAGSRMLSRSRQ